MRADFFRLDHSAVVLGRLHGDWQSQAIAGPGCLIGASEERIKDFGHFFRRNAGAFILNGNLKRAVRHHPAMNRHLSAVRREPESVPDDILNSMR